MTTSLSGLTPVSTPLSDLTQMTTSLSGLTPVSTPLSGLTQVSPLIAQTAASNFTPSHAELATYSTICVSPQSTIDLLSHSHASLESPEFASPMQTDVSVLRSQVLSESDTEATGDSPIRTSTKRSHLPQNSPLGLLRVCNTNTTKKPRTVTIRNYPKGLQRALCSHQSQCH